MFETVLGLGGIFVFFWNFVLQNAFLLSLIVKKYCFGNLELQRNFIESVYFLFFSGKYRNACLPDQFQTLIKGSITVILIKKTLLICIQYLPCSYQKIFLTKLNLSIQKYYISGAYSYW